MKRYLGLLRVRQISYLTHSTSDRPKFLAFLALLMDIGTELIHLIFNIKLNLPNVRDHNTFPITCQATNPNLRWRNQKYYNSSLSHQTMIKELATLGKNSQQ